VDPAITITTGSVTLDLKGYTISNIFQPPIGSTGASVDVEIPINATTNNISIRNGTIKNFEQGVAIIPQSGPTFYISNIRVNQITFITKYGYIGVHLRQANSSSISNCRFIGCGIAQGGNRYNNNSLIGGSMLV